MTEFVHGHALIVGAGGDLPTTVKDAEDIYDMLVDPELCAYPKSQVELLCNQDADRDAVLEALDRLALRVREDPQSTVVVYFSGHGLGGKTSRLLTHGYDLDRLADTTISSDEFMKRLRAIESGKLLVLLDCCHASGQADAEKGPLPKAPIPIAALEEFTRGSGRVVLASSRADEYSFTHDDNSYFTEALLEGFSGHGASELDGYTRVLDIAMYVGRVVPNRKRDRQHPVLKVWNLSNNFTLSYYAGGFEEPKGLRKIRQGEMLGLEGAASGTDYNRTVTTLWTILGTLLLYTSYNLFALTQDWPLLFWTAFRDLGDATVSLFGLYWGLPALAILMALTRYYRDLDDRDGFYTRLPVAFNLPLYSNTTVRRRYQALFLFLFFIFPLYTQGHFMRKMLEGQVYDRAGSAEIPVVKNISEHFWPFLPESFGDRYRLDSIGGVTFFPFMLPWILLALEVALFCSFFVLVFKNTNFWHRRKTQSKRRQ